MFYGVLSAVAHIFSFSRTTAFLVSRHGLFLRLFGLVTQMAGDIAKIWVHVNPNTAFATMVSALSFVCSGRAEEVDSESKREANARPHSTVGAGGFPQLGWPLSAEYFGHAEAVVCPAECVIPAAYWAVADPQAKWMRKWCQGVTHNAQLAELAFDAGWIAQALHSVAAGPAFGPGISSPAGHVARSNDTDNSERLNSLAHTLPPAIRQELAEAVFCHDVHVLGALLNVITQRRMLTTGLSRGAMPDARCWKSLRQHAACAVFTQAMPTCAHPAFNGLVVQTVSPRSEEATMPQSEKRGDAFSQNGLGSTLQTWHDAFAVLKSWCFGNIGSGPAAMTTKHAVVLQQAARAAMMRTIQQFSVFLDTDTDFEPLVQYCLAAVTAPHSSTDVRLFALDCLFCFVGEPDQVALTYGVGGRAPDGSVRRCLASLLEQESSEAALVGITAVAGQTLASPRDATANIVGTKLSALLRTFMQLGSRRAITCVCSSAVPRHWVGALRSLPRASGHADVTTGVSQSLLDAALQGTQVLMLASKPAGARFVASLCETDDHFARVVQMLWAGYRCPDHPSAGSSCCSCELRVRHCSAWLQVCSRGGAGGCFNLVGAPKVRV